MAAPPPNATTFTITAPPTSPLQPPKPPLHHQSYSAASQTNCSDLDINSSWPYFTAYGRLRSTPRLTLHSHWASTALRNATMPNLNTASITFTAPLPRPPSTCIAWMYPPCYCHSDASQYNEPHAHRPIVSRPPAYHTPRPGAPPPPAHAADPAPPLASSMPPERSVSQQSLQLPVAPLRQLLTFIAAQAMKESAEGSVVEAQIISFNGGGGGGVDHRRRLKWRRRRRWAMDHAGTVDGSAEALGAAVAKAKEAAEYANFTILKIYSEILVSPASLAAMGSGSQSSLR